MGSIQPQIKNLTKIPLKTQKASNLEGKFLFLFLINQKFYENRVSTANKITLGRNIRAQNSQITKKFTKKRGLSAAKQIQLKF